MNDSGDTKTLAYDELPAMIKAYPRMLRSRAGLAREGEPLPALRAVTGELPIDREHVDTYRRICGIPDPGDYTLPLLYPQVLAAPLHMHLMAHPDFPLRAIGMIHVRNTITQHRPLRVYEPLRFEVTLRGTRPARKGHEFDLITHAFADDQLVWEATTTILSPVRGKSSGRKKERSDAAPEGELERSITLRVREDQGRRYASISGDYNPIHVHALSAKLFGFKRAIAHGMWTLGRAMGELHDDLPAPPCHLEVRFKRPVLLPTSILVTSRRRPGALDLDVTTVDGKIPHLAATLTALLEQECSEPEEE